MEILGIGDGYSCARTLAALTPKGRIPQRPRAFGAYGGLSRPVLPMLDPVSFLR